ncbi:MAG TPA: methylmalonyl Co-A mutase-associated GTPase MeaB [Chloroflexota bacterium]|jgi:LAO/AO transport system kinase
MPSSLAERVLCRDPGAIARLISLVEDGNPAAHEPFAAVYPHGGQTYVVGVTGAPGSGKSTLVDGLLTILRSQNLTAAVLAVDPSSPHGGGAILGDRVRMQRHAQDPGVFIRSMSARGSLGGLALSTRQAMHILDAAGFQYCILETVGVGQSELAISAAADTTVVVVTPAMGDAIQTLKAGILEIADLFALNKADQPGAREALHTLRAMLHRLPAAPWHIPIVETEAHRGHGVPQLWEQILAHRHFQEASDGLAARRADQARIELHGLVEHGLRTEVLRSLTGNEKFRKLVGEVAGRRQDPLHAARQILAEAACLPSPVESEPTNG